MYDLYLIYLIKFLIITDSRMMNCIIYNLHIRQNNLNSGEQTKKILYILGIIIFISIVIGLICFFIYRGR